jgi:hypothetical protein
MCRFFSERSALNVRLAPRRVADHDRQLRRALFPGPDRPHEIVQLDSMCSGGASDELEGLLEIEAVPLRHDPFCLFDRNPRLQRMLELGAALICGLGHGH